MTKTWCVGGKQKSNTNNITQYEKSTLELNLLKLLKELAVFVEELRVKFFLNK